LIPLPGAAFAKSRGSLKKGLSSQAYTFFPERRRK